MRSALLMFGIFGLLGCAGSGTVGGGGGLGVSSAANERDSNTVKGAAVRSETGSSPVVRGGDVVAIVEGEPVSWGAIREMLVESSGGHVLSEWVLSYTIEKALKREGLVVTEADVLHEKSVLLNQFSKDADQAVLLLKRLRTARGLGVKRFELQLRRNAGLRKLVVDEVKVSDEMIAAEYGRRHGPTTEVRMILVPRLTDVQVVKDRLRGGASFVDLALELSVDSSRRQGGLMPLISPWDDTFPQAIRTVSAKLNPGEVSEPLSLEQGFAILRCERKIKGSGVELASVVDEMEAHVRDRVEQVLMARRARVLLNEAEVSVLDAGLNDVWRQALEAGAAESAGG